MKLILNCTDFFTKCILFMIIILPYMSFSNPPFLHRCKIFISQMIKQRSPRPVQSKHLKRLPYAKNMHQLRTQHETETSKEDQHYYQAIQKLFHLQNQLEEATDSEHIKELEQKIKQARDKIENIYNNNLENKLTRLNEIRLLEERPPLTKEEISKQDQIHSLLHQVMDDPK